MPSAFLSALHEEGTREEIIAWLNKLHAENLQLRGLTTIGISLAVSPETPRQDLLNEVTRLFDENSTLTQAHRGLQDAPPTRVEIDGTTRQAYYGTGEQPWDVIKRNGWAHHFAAGNVLKYLRRDKPGQEGSDVEKARWYYRELLALAGNYNPLELNAVIHFLRHELRADELKRLGL